MKKILQILLVLCFPHLVMSQCMGITNATTIVLHNGALVAGTANTVGAKYRYSNAATGVDVLATIVSLTKTGVNSNNFTFVTPDAAANFTHSSQAAIGGFDNNFQPYWLSHAANYVTGATTLEAVFTFELSDASANGTTVIPVYRNLVLSSIDNDGSNANAIIQEEVAYSPAATAYGLNSPTNQVNVSPGTYRGPATNQPNIGLGPNYVSYAYYFNVSSITWHSRHYFTMNSTMGLGEAARLSSLSFDCGIAPGNLAFPVLNISGNVFNDTDALTDNRVDGTNIGSVNGNRLYVNLLNSSGTVIASTPVDNEGKYSFKDIKNQSDYSIQLSTLNGTVGQTPPADQLAPNWIHTGQNVGPGNGSDGVVDSRVAVSVNVANVNNINFGIQRGPESAINAQPIQGNPAFFFFVPVPASAFFTNNVGVASNTSDYDGGLVNSIRITSFPSNINALRIGSTTYISGTGVCPPGATCTNWPATGVVVPYTNGTGATTPVSIDPIDGSVNVVINYAAIDNGGMEDPTPGTVSQPFVIVLPLKINAFDVKIQGSATLVSLSVTEKMPGATLSVERSTNGVHFTAIGTLPGNNGMNYSYTDVAPVQQEKNYYRVKIVSAGGETLYTDIKMVRLGGDTRVDVYPVPAGNVLNIAWNTAVKGNVTIQLVSPSGQTVINTVAGANTNHTTLNVSNLPAGYYQLQVAAGNELLNRQKIIKQ